MIVGFCKSLAGLTLALALAFPAVNAAEDLATALVRNTSERMLSTLETRRAEIDRNPSLIYALVEDIVLPHFDFERITQSAVGRHWREATPAQREALVNGFRQVLVRTYAQALLGYSGEEIRYLPVKPGRQSDSVTVSTEVRGRGAPPIPIDYRLYLKGGAWKVYDVVVDNVSLVSNYRSSFATQVRQGGIDGLIARLQEMNARGQG
ncbi:MAG: ABC transporter substrate-binding protein [Chromatiaceae bacterium]|jgi:phospholipid transport system substrate-binding protein|nr:ABC transporter substrate-binding protein [Chromatiaceae bacterium]